MSQLPERKAQSTSSGSILPTILGVGAFAAAGLGLAWIAYSRTRIEHDIPLTAALDGELTTFKGRRAGRLAYYAAGPARRGAPPLILIHSVNAAASSYEMKPLYDHYAHLRRVYALDLPGYGFSERSERRYAPALFRDAILDLIEGPLGGASVDAVALSLGSEFLALATAAQPALFRTLTFISPSGFSPHNRKLRPVEGLFLFLRVRFWSRPIYDLLTSRPSLKYFLQASQRTTVKRAAVNYAYVTSHQPNAEIAPFHFVSFKLFTPDIFNTYRALTQPCLLLYGRDPFVQYDYVSELANCANWRIVPLPNTGALTHWDSPAIVVEQMDKMFAV